MTGARKIPETPVIMAGSTGTRLWLLSRAGYPKRFLVLPRPTSLSQQVVARLQGLVAADIEVGHPRFRLHYGNLTDSTNLARIIQQVRPDEIYNLAAMSHLAVHLVNPGVTARAGDTPHALRRPGRSQRDRHLRQFCTSVAHAVIDLR